MNKEKYIEMRNSLLGEAEGLIAEGKLEESNDKMKEIEELDNKWEEVKLANANINALKDKAKAVELEEKSIQIEGAKIVDDLVKETKMDESKIYENAWAKVMMGKPIDGEEKVIFDKVNAEFKNDYTHTTVSTATLIPETVIAGIWKRAEEMYPLFEDVRKYNVRGTLILNKHNAIVAGDAAWYDEATATVDEQNQFGQVILSGCELSKVVTVSWKLRSMAVEDFIPFITNELAERVGMALGTAVAQGLGKPGDGESFKAQPLGIETALLAEDDDNPPQVVTYDSTDPATYEKITELISKLHSSYLNGAAFYANNSTIWTVLANITDDLGRPIFIPDPSMGGVGMMLGFVVKADAGVSAGNVIFGNPAQGYIFNTNEPPSVATEEHVKARTVDYAIYAVVDGAPIDTKAFALLKKSA